LERGQGILFVLRGWGRERGQDKHGKGGNREGMEGGKPLRKENREVGGGKFGRRLEKGLVDGWLPYCGLSHQKGKEKGQRGTGGKLSV